MSFCRWSSILERWQGVTLALYASVLMHRLDSESSNSEESSLGAGGSSRSDSSNSNSNSSSMCSNSTSSSDCFSSLDRMGTIDSTLVIEEVIQMSVQRYECMETGMEDNSTPWGKKIWIEDLSEDDAGTHFWFSKVHLQEVANQLWPWLQFYLSGHNGAVKVENGKYSLPYETLLLLVLYRLSRPRRLRKDMESFFGICIARMSSAINFMIHAMHALRVLYLDNPKIFHWRMPYYAERVFNKCGLTETVW